MNELVQVNDSLKWGIDIKPYKYSVAEHISPIKWVEKNIVEKQLSTKQFISFILENRSFELVHFSI